MISGQRRVKTSDVETFQRHGFQPDLAGLRGAYKRVIVVIFKIPWCGDIMTDTYQFKV